MTSINELFEKQNILLTLYEGFTKANKEQFIAYCKTQGYEYTFPREWNKDTQRFEDAKK